MNKAYKVKTEQGTWKSNTAMLHDKALQTLSHWSTSHTTTKEFLSTLYKEIKLIRYTGHSPISVNVMMDL